MLLYQTTARSSPTSSTATRLTASLVPWLGAAAIAVTFVYADTAAFPWFWALPPVLGAACLIGGAQANTEHPLRKLLSHPAAVWLGKRSYSLYLWHWPVFVLLRWTVGLDELTTRVIGVALSLLLATASYRWVELPIRHHAGLQKRAPIVRILLLLALVVVGWGATKLLFTQQKNLGLSTVARHADDWYVTGQMPRALLPAAEFPRPCQTQMESRALAGGQVISYLPQSCAAGITKSARNLFVIGDSHATAYLPMFDQLSAETGMAVRVYTFAGCSLLDLRLPMNVGRSPGCGEFMQTATSDVVAAANGGDVVLLAALRQPRFADQWAAFNAADVLRDATGAQANLWLQAARDEAAALLAPFINKGIVVLFDAPKPIFRSPTFRCADGFNAHNPVCKGGLTAPRQSLLALRAPVVANIVSLATKFPQSVAMWDPFPTLCPGETCSAIDGTRPLFFDGDHLSAYGNARLYPEFRAIMSPAAK